MRNGPVPTLTVEDKAMRKAVIDDFCARNGVQTIRAVDEPLPVEELMRFGSAIGYRHGRLSPVSRQVVRR
jgi:hypothetical protein